MARRGAIALVWGALALLATGACANIVGIGDLPPVTTDGAQTSCTYDTDCLTGQTCVGSLCWPNCHSNSDCPTLWQCNPWHLQNSTIVGGSVCEPHCNPLSPQMSDSTHLGCNAGETCYAGAMAGYAPFTDCAGGVMGSVAEGQTCTNYKDCAVGDLCVPTTGDDGGSEDICAAYCNWTASTGCNPGFSCERFPLPRPFDGVTEIGFCKPMSQAVVDQTAAAAAAATAYCQAYEVCTPFLLQEVYGDVATCTRQETVGVLETLAAPGSSYTTALAMACASAFPGTSCADLLDNNWPSACRSQTGTVANGGSCGDSSQCASTYCNVPSGQTCGTCAALSPNGGSCSQDAECPVGSTCTNSTCVVPGDVGAVCNATTRPCLATLICRAGACDSPDLLGSSCTVTSNTDTYGTCGAYSGNFCTATLSSSGTCQAFIFATATAPGCGYLNGVWPICGTTGFCQGSTSTARGTCQAASAVGQTCSDTGGPLCLSPAVCVSGVCTLPDPTKCP